MRVLVRYQLDTLHTPIVLSRESDAKYSPFGENTKLSIEEEWPLRVVICFSIHIFHRLIVLSIDPDAKYSPLGENTTLSI